MHYQQQERLRVSTLLSTHALWGITSSQMDLFGRVDGIWFNHLPDITPGQLLIQAILSIVKLVQPYFLLPKVA